MKTSMLSLPLSLLCVAILSCGDAYDDASSSPNPRTEEPSTAGEPAPDPGSVSTNPAPSATGSLSGSVQPIFTANCSCHLGAIASAGQNLAEGKAYSNIVSVQSTTGSCTNLKRIEPGKPDNSALIKRIEGSTCGAQMPKGRSPLSSDSISQIRKWVEAGAPNN